MRTTFVRGLLVAALALPIAGCAPVEYRGAVAVAATTPDLVYVAPGVQVIADYGEPIFYSDGFYWWSLGGVWYRSGTYTGGWISVSMPPAAVVQIREPYRYRHYRPSGYVVQRRPVPASRVQRPVVRDHRARR